MTDTNRPNAEVAKKPAYVAYIVRKREGQTALWTKIGAGWPNADGKGINVHIEACPHDGRFVLRLASEKKD